MELKAPVMLLVLVETAHLRWFVAGVALDGQVMPLLCSEEGDLHRYVALDFDEQVSFLRHRFCGVLQKGCDRLWARGKKANQFAIVFQGPLAEASGKLTVRVAEHFAEWMLNPPVAVFNMPPGASPSETFRLERLAGQIAQPLEDLLHGALDGVHSAMQDPSAWEQVPKKVY